MNCVLASCVEFKQIVSTFSAVIEVLKKKREHLDILVSFIPAESFDCESDFYELCEVFEGLGVYRCLLFRPDGPFRFAHKEDLLASDIIILGGGNTFTLMKYLRDCGLEADLREFSQKRGVLIGNSAGAIVQTPGLKMAALPDFDRDENEVGLRSQKAMGLVPYEIFPHFMNSRRYSEEILRYSKTKNRLIYGIPDGSSLFQREQSLLMTGKVFGFYQGFKFSLASTSSSYSDEKKR